MIDPSLADGVEAALAALSPGDFEVFVCDAVAELTGARVRRARGGYQAGRDATVAGALPTMIECKRYTSSALSDRELIGEMHLAQAAGCELWVLAATCEVADQTAAQLGGAAMQLGMSFSILDWPAGQDKPLLALAAGAPGAARRHLGAPGVALVSLPPDPARSGAVAKLLRELTAPLVSAEMLRRRLAERLEASFGDAPALRRDFGARPPASPAGDPWGGFVDRPAIESRLDEWWARGAPGGVPAVLLGDEGAGKSLMALRWLRSRARAGDLVFPIKSDVVFSIDDPVDVIAALLVRLFGEDAERWRLRLRSIFSHPAVSEGLRIVLYLDGINENPGAPWDGLLNALQAQPLRGQVGVLMSCRPWPYEHRFSGFPALERRPERIPVGLFDADELRRALELHGRRLGDFPAGMHPLLARPRLFALALRNERALREAGEYTPARLFWEDWRDRLAAGRRILSGEQYRTALVSVAQALDRRAADGPAPMDAVVLGSAIDRALWAAEGAGVREQTISEIIDGGLARIDAGVLHLHPVFAGLALGLDLYFILLARHRGGETDHARLKDTARLALEPWGGADFGASVARFAAWASVELADTPVTVQSAVLALWLEEQNYAETHRDDAAGIVRRAPGAAFEVAEDVWMREPSKAALALQRAFEPALHPGFRAGALRERMIACVRRWAGRIGVDCGRTRMLARSTDTQRVKALTHVRFRGGEALEIGAYHELCGEVFRIGGEGMVDGQGAAVFGLDTLAASGAAGLAAVVRTAAVLMVVEPSKDLLTACVRLLRRLDGEDVALRTELRGEIPRLAEGYGVPGAEAAKLLAWMLDLPDDDRADAPEPEHWSAASPAFRARFGAGHLHRVSNQILWEALLEPDSDLTLEILEPLCRLDFFASAPPVDFQPVLDAAFARGMPVSGLRANLAVWVEHAGDAEDAEDAEEDDAGELEEPEAVRGAGSCLDVPALLRAALFDDLAATRQRAWDTLADAPESRSYQDSVRSLTDDVYIVVDGEPSRMRRDGRVLPGRWVAAAAGGEAPALSALVDKALGAGARTIAEHLALRPGLVYGLAQAALLAELPRASELWQALASSWQAFYLLPDRRNWYFDLPFEAPDSPAADLLRTFVLDAASTEAQLLDVTLAVRRWGRRRWLQSAIERDLASVAAWRVARALVLGGMMGTEPPGEPISDPDLAPSWLSSVALAAFRYARREGRMRYWASLAARLESPARARAAAAVLEADADHRLSLIVDELEVEPNRRVLLDRLIRKLEARDPHAAGLGRMNGFLEIPPHPWLGPPGMPHSPFERAHRGRARHRPGISLNSRAVSYER